MAATTTLRTRTKGFAHPQYACTADYTAPNIVGPTMLGLVASVLAVVCKRMQQLPTTRNMKQGVQTDATCNIQQCCVRFHGD